MRETCCIMTETYCTKEKHMRIHTEDICINEQIGF